MFRRNAFLDSWFLIFAFVNDIWPLFWDIYDTIAIFVQHPLGGEGRHILQTSLDLRGGSPISLR